MGIRNAVLAAVNTAQTTTEAPAKVPAEFYLNIGFETDDPQFPFVDLPKAGIALDKIELHDVRGDLTPYKSFLAMQNALVESFLDRARMLNPGEVATVSLDEQTGLAMQIRRVANKEMQPKAVAEIKGISFR